MNVLFSNHIRSSAIPKHCLSGYNHLLLPNKNYRTSEHLNHYRGKRNKNTTSISHDSKLLLYRSSSVIFPRTLLSLTSLNACYWSWYVIDFIPTLLQSELNVYPELGYIGFIASIGMLIGSAAYPRYLISEITLKLQLPKQKNHTNANAGASFEVKRFTLPFCTIEEKGMTVKSIQWMDTYKNTTDDFTEHVFMKLGDSDGNSTNFLMHVKPNEMKHFHVWQNIYYGKTVLSTTNTATKGVADAAANGRKKKRGLKEDRLRRRNN